MGVRGTIAFSDNISGSPLSPCIYYMHCVLIVEYQSLPHLHLKLMTERKFLESFKKHVNEIAHPCELVSIMVRLTVP